ncbi:MAG: hypothetical protein KatS3mg108_0482 [Isosphaeraceae bacterium]|nr:MAG: hypothetical protein KatS3mg108_0482 [Isosphaeraceae bacterium]
MSHVPERSAPDDDLTEMAGTTDPELRRMLGLYDTPAFARRGQDLEHALGRVRLRCRAERERLAEMVLVRLRQWARVATGPADGVDVFDEPPGTLAAALGDPPLPWALARGGNRRRREAARALTASVVRFNRNWVRFLNGLDLRVVNQAIDHYNRYYLLEKECCLGSPRLAARGFVPMPELTANGLLAEFPPLPEPRLTGPQA